MIPKISELEKYNNLKIKVSYDQNPLNCWKENEKKTYSTESLLAKKYPSIVATSVPCDVY